MRDLACQETPQIGDYDEQTGSSRVRSECECHVPPMPADQTYGPTVGRKQNAVDADTIPRCDSLRTFYVEERKRAKEYFDSIAGLVERFERLLGSRQLRVERVNASDVVDHLIAPR
jgi:hypothetical protein